MYTYEEAYQATKEYFNGNELAAKITVDKYSLKNTNNDLIEKTPEDIHRRIAKEFARIELGKFKKPLTEDEIFNFLDKFTCIIPQGSPLSGIGNKDQIVSLSNCFVVESPEDSYGGILRADQELVQISKRRGGVGVDLSTLRPTNSPTKNSSKTSTGMATWMERYSNSIREVGQNGRRGALMETLSVHHPDIETFIAIKNDDTKVTGANISVRLTDEFLNAVEQDTQFELRFPVNSKNPSVRKSVKAKDLWNKIIFNAWNRGEPGILFWDNILRESPTDCYEFFKTVCTNPCSEIPLSIYDSCRLLVINLMCFINDPFGPNASFDYREFYEIAQIAQRLMDDLVDLELECIDRILAKIELDPETPELKVVEKNLWIKVRKACVDGRRTGLGLTAVGDCIAALNIKYGSDASIVEVDRIYKTLKFGSYRSSVDMAKELGPFKVWDWELEKNNPFINRIKDEAIVFASTQPTMMGTYGIVEGKRLFEDIKKYGRRNIADLTNAPCGSISNLASFIIKSKLYTGVTSGIEPMFKTHYTRRKKGNPGDKDFRVDFKDQNGDCWMEFPVYHTGVQAWMDVTGKTELDESCPYVGASAEEIDWVKRVELQAAAQRHIDHAISSTINLPKEATQEEVAKIYNAAWKAGLKGITVYRDGCRTGVLVSSEPEKVVIEQDRPKELPCDVYHLTSKGQQYFVLIGLLQGKPYEIFAGKNGFLDKGVKSGRIVRKARRVYKAIFDDVDTTELCPITQSCSDHEETITRLTSALLRSGAAIHLIVEQLEKVHGDMTSFAKIVARALKKYIKDGTKVVGEACPECKQTNIVRAEGCKKCVSCGWTACL